jgi:hypothetical protein
MHVRYYAHIVNLIVFARLYDIDEFVVKIRNAIRFVRFSPSMQIIFNQYTKRLKIGSRKSIHLDAASR